MNDFQPNSDRLASISNTTKARHIAIWLLFISFLIYLMIAMGGYTRLTNSGLSMVKWEPITGIMPPLSSQKWQSEFDLYKQFPEYQLVNQNMTLTQFKRIYWIEYLHRLVGRMLAICFFIPFCFFWIKRYLSLKLALRLGGIFLLGGLQGVLGWYMVQSGLIDDPAVSQYRLTAHLGLAVALYAYVLWLSLQFLDFSKVSFHEYSKSVRIGAIVCIAVVGLMLVSGGFMAGTRAGFVFNTYPLIDGRWWPELMFSLSPIWKNALENVVAIQFIHRWIAALTVMAIFVLWLFRFVVKNFFAKLVLDLLLGAAVLQFCLGLVTLLSKVEFNFALLHQTGFVLLLTFLIIVLRSSFTESQTLKYKLQFAKVSLGQ